MIGKDKKRKEKDRVKKGKKPMKKRILLICAALVLVLTLSTVLALTIAGETETPAAPELTIDFANLSFRNEVCIKYAVSAENAEFVKLLVWTTPQTSYTKGTEDKVLNPVSPEIINGVEYKYVFDYTDLTAKQMTDYVYVVAYTEVDGTAYYSDVVKYSILQYAYNKLGYTGTATTNEKLTKMLKAMLEYGAAAQEYNGYKTETLANADFSQITTENAVLPDGFTFGLYKSGTKVDVTAVTAENQMVHNWVDANGELVYNLNATFEATAPAAKGETSTYAAEIVGKSAGGSFIYELDAMPAPVVVDGVKDKLYDINGFNIPAMFLLPKVDGKLTGDTFDVYFTADEAYVYVFYDFQKNYTPHWSDTYSYKYHIDCVDFVLRADGFEGKSTDFRINAKGGDHTGTVSVAPYADGKTTISLSYAVKHKDPTGADKGYYVEFAIPLDKVTGTDGNGNKMLSFTALSTLNFTDPEAWDEKTNPTQRYTCSWKAHGQDKNDGQAKDLPSFIVIKSVQQVNEPDTAPTKVVNGEDGKPKNFVYEITKNNAPLTVDGMRDDGYANGIHQVSTLGYSGKSNNTKFDMYIAADSGRLYVLYEFIKEYPICYGTGNYWIYDALNMVINPTNAYAAGTEFRIYGVNEGGKGEAKTHSLPAWIDNYHVKYTAQGYNVEFSIPLSKITSTDENGNKQLGYLATATVNYQNETYRCNPTTNNALGLHAANDNGTKKHLSVVVIKNDFVLEETTDTVKQDGYKDAAYDNGIYTPSAFNNPDANNCFDFYMTADSNYVYGLYIVKDNNIITGGYRAADNIRFPYYSDCIDFCYNINGSYNGTGCKEFRIWGAYEGTNHYLTKNDDESYKYDDVLAYGIKGGDNAGVTALALVDSYTVVKTDVGYNVEFKIARSRFDDPDVFSFMAVSTAATSQTARVYGHIDNAGNAGNKNNMLVVTIVK